MKMMNLKFRWLRKALYVIIGLWFLMLPIIFFAQRFIVFQPKPLAYDYKYEFNLPHQELFLPVSGGDTINALMIKCRQQPSRGVILYFHGNADNLARWGKYHEDLTSRGYDFFVIDYRGYGKSTGQPNEEKMYEDARLCYDYLHQSYDGQQIIIYGRSLGSGIAAELASRVPSRMVILETPYNNINCAIAKHILLNRLPYNLNYNFNTEQYIPKISAPIYVFHGTRDWVIPYACAKKIKPLLTSKDKFVTIIGGGHRNLNEFSEFGNSLDEMLR